MDIASMLTGAVLGTTVTWFVNHGLTEWRDGRKRKTAEAKARVVRYNKLALGTFKRLIELRAVCTAGDAYEDEELSQRFIEAVERYSLAVNALNQAGDDLQKERADTLEASIDSLEFADRAVTLVDAAAFAAHARLPLDRPMVFLDQAWDELADCSESVRRYIELQSLDKTRH